ncbi:hypothetical protein BN8_04686 [Fibrisoma limi BUZ 3]|uniref:DUF5683 domain-containing protein n=1 Tax=Fibrisoma limi BUZ 3 TaxID=1185876 RepID=I2GNF0_9BACT|nr:DUF5683 domain-containing protein [Fibrisoma limi]CCH55428.1 hypothetical protein BN8_04686 [Fibrisoma limi BUZ 3]
MKHFVHLTLVTLFCIGLTTTNSTAQVGNAPVAIDTLPPATVPVSPVKVGESELIPVADSVAQIATDTLRVTPTQQAKIRKIVPRKATIRSLLVPGLGQIYNRQYWKLPFIYGGLAGAIIAFRWNQDLYNQYVSGYREAFNSTSSKVAVVRGQVLSVDQLKRASDQFRRQRDLTVILTAAGWALNAVEANVAAHLKTFDLSDDLTLKIHPSIQPTGGLGIVPGVRLAMTFN